MVGVLSVRDFRESESWNIARFVVCAILDLTDSWSKTIELERLAGNIERLSIMLLDSIAKGYEGDGDPGFLARATETADQLETELENVRQRGMLDHEDFLSLQQDLDDVKVSLKHAQSQV